MTVQAEDRKPFSLNMNVEFYSLRRHLRHRHQLF